MQVEHVIAVIAACAYLLISQSGQSGLNRKAKFKQHFAHYLRQQMQHCSDVEARPDFWLVRNYFAAVKQQQDGMC